MGIIPLNYSYYPILYNLRGSIKELDEQTILHARDNIDKYKPIKIVDVDMPVWLASTIILHNLKNNFLIRKFVTNYGKLFESHFSTDIKNKEVRKAVLYYLDVFNDLKIVGKNRIALHMNDYLEIALLLQDQPFFNLVHSDLEKGYVHMDTPRFVYLTRLAIEVKLYEKIKSMPDYYGNDIINKVVSELGGVYPETKKKISRSSTVIPQTIQQLIDKAYSEHHLAHHERIKLGIYLQGQNYDMDYILDIFRQLSDWDEKVTRYQLNSLKRYIKP